MNVDIKLHKKDLPDDYRVSNTIAIDCEMGGLNVNRDPLFLVQISSGNLDAHIIQLDRENYQAPKLLSILEDNKIKKIFHYARADLGFLKNYLLFFFHPLFYFLHNYYLLPFQFLKQKGV